MKRAPSVHLTFQPNVPSHEIDQPPTDRQTQSDPSMLPSRGIVGLIECLENRVLFLGRNPSTRIAYGKMQNNCFGHTLLHGNVHN